MKARQELDEFFPESAVQIADRKRFKVRKVDVREEG